MSGRQPTFSLILATYGSGRYIRRFLESMRDNADCSFEVIVVDQNKDPHTKLIEEFSKVMAVSLVRSAPGLSVARNVGIRVARGAVLAFPDDDCWYPRSLLASVEARLEDVSIAGLTCRCTDEHGSLAAGSEDRNAGLVTKRNVWGRGVSATLFMRRELIESIGYFDETLGLGARTEFQSGEETDYLLRAIKGGFRIQYDPSLSVFHPLPSTNIEAGAVRKSWSYALGMGRVLRVHEYGLLEVLRFIVTPLLGAAGALVQGNGSVARIRYARAFGRYRGWRWQADRDTSAHL